MSKIASIGLLLMSTAMAAGQAPLGWSVGDKGRLETGTWGCTTIAAYTAVVDLVLQDDIAAARKLRDRHTCRDFVADEPVTTAKASSIYACIRAAGDPDCYWMLLGRFK